jgi:predicted nucleotidyltransferase
MNQDFNPLDFLIFECITGSNLYGTATPLSDMDYRGICIPPLEVLLNPFMSFDQKDSGFEENF